MTRKLVEIKITDDNDVRSSELELLVDGQTLGYGGYGGEPEDNTRHRDYAWVEELLYQLAKALGADVEVIRKLGYLHPGDE